MAQYLLSVHYVDDKGATEATHVENTGTEMSDEDMQAAFERVNAFNEKLQAEGNWVFAGGLQRPDGADLHASTRLLLRHRWNSVEQVPDDLPMPSWGWDGTDGW